jgi:hypothetical protein
MEIKLSESELQFLATTYGDPSVRFEFTGIDKFTVYHPKATVPCEIVKFTNRSIRIQYELSFLKNLLVNWFVNVEKDGIFWNKQQNQLDIDPFTFLPEKERKATEHLKIEGVSLEPGLLQIRIGIIPETFLG